ncbi:MAG: potassium ABC transporter ATPase [Peptococcaceae bacterium BRH_c8a]|nr:MAG: potassium ABC transporter ATPase [Peptococcaceae bacterium BRH_c8a]
MATVAIEKLSRLQNIITDCQSVVVAFSGGVDSALLLKVAVDTLGDKVMAVTLRSMINPPGEVDEALLLAGAIDVKHVIIDFDPLKDEEFVSNPSLRCYYCKKKIMGLVLELARGQGYRHVLDGVNADDTGDYRPGMRAVRELGVKSPLLEAGLTKAEIRELSRRMGLPTSEKPSAACLASRFPYGTRITVEALQKVAAAEVFLRNKGYTQVRVRNHGDLARIEVPGAEITDLLMDKVIIATKLKELGFIYVTIDLQGYRTGSMNETL